MRRSAFVSGVVICIVLAIPTLAAVQAGEIVSVGVNAPAYVEGTFEATMDVDNITDFNSGQFDLSFNSSVVNVTDVADGNVDGETIPIDEWVFVDKNKIRVILDVPGIAGISGAGYLANISFDLVGSRGDISALGISNGMLVDTDAEEIPAEWINYEVIVGPRAVKVEVNAPAYVEGTFEATMNVDNITDFNSGQFDLSFNSSVVNVTDVTDGSVDGETIPVDMWEFMDKDRIRVILDIPGITSVNGSGYLANISFEVIGSRGDISALDISNGMLVDTEAEELPAEWIDTKVTVKVPIFDTSEGTYPSIFGLHEGNITLAKDISVQKMYTYPCAGTGGHSEYVKIWGDDLNVSATWKGYTGDFHNIVFNETFTLYAGKTYYYIIKTGSYPQIHHTRELEVESGTIRCTKFTDANGKISEDWIPAIELW